MEDLDGQLKRIVSHLESERRVYGQHGERLNTMEGTIKRMEERLLKYENIMFNKGSGVLFDLDRLKQDKHRKESSWPNIISIVSLLVSLGLGIIMVLK